MPAIELIAGMARSYNRQTIISEWFAGLARSYSRQTIASLS